MNGDADVRRRSAPRVVPTKFLFAFGPAALGLAAATQAQPWSPFIDSTDACGVRTNHAPAGNLLISFLNLAPMTGGAAVADFNNDGFQDIFFVSSGGTPDRLFINNGDSTFTDRAAQWGLNESHMGIGVSAADYNNDGLVDLYVTSLGLSSNQPEVGRHRLYRNNGGSFTNVAAQARVNRTTTVLPDGFGSCWGDYDLDGDLDLFVTSWISGTGGNRLFRNNGDGPFTDVTVAAGAFSSTLRGFSPRFVDMNNDRYPELIVSGDFHTSRYFINNRNGTFTNSTVASGVGLDDNGMGSAVGDFNNDGLPDWYVTSIYTTHPLAGVPGTGNMLYMNQGNHHFLEQSVPAGVNRGGWGWGTVAVDFNHDGLEDIIETNGWHQSNSAGMTEWADDVSHAFVNRGGGLFSDVGPDNGIAMHTAQGRAMCAVDFDNDGDLDVFIVTYNGPTTLFRSEIVSGGVTPPDAHWLRVFLDAHQTPGVAPNGYGAEVRAVIGKDTLHRFISPGSTYLGQSEASAHFGFGSAAVVDRLVVEWPNGRINRRSNLPAAQTLTIRYCPPDWNGSGDIDSQDCFDFIVNLFEGDADYNGVDGTNSQDLFDFLPEFFAGCS